MWRWKVHTLSTSKDNFTTQFIFFYLEVIRNRGRQRRFGDEHLTNGQKLERERDSITQDRGENLESACAQRGVADISQVLVCVSALCKRE